MFISHNSPIYFIAMAMWVLLFVIFHWKRLLLLLKLHIVSCPDTQASQSFYQWHRMGSGVKMKVSPCPHHESLLLPGRAPSVCWQWTPRLCGCFCSCCYHYCHQSGPSPSRATNLGPYVPWTQMCVFIWGGQAYCSVCMLLSLPVQVPLLRHNHSQRCHTA